MAMSTPRSGGHRIEPSRRRILRELLLLICAPTATSTRLPRRRSRPAGLARALLADPAPEGLQLIARDGASAAVAFATVLVELGTRRWRAGSGSCTTSTWPRRPRLGSRGDLIQACLECAAGRRSVGARLGDGAGEPPRARPSTGASAPALVLDRLPDRGRGAMSGEVTAHIRRADPIAPARVGRSAVEPSALTAWRPACGSSRDIVTAALRSELAPPRYTPLIGGTSS